MPYDNNNSGALFKNDRKREGKKDPDYTGSVEVDGVGYWIDAWIKNKDTPGKKTLLSLSFRPKEKKQYREEDEDQRRPHHSAPPPPPTGIDEDWP